jgi:hypothetical protein
LTFSVHSRIDETIERVIDGVRAGNVYVNRNMIGRWSASSHSAARACREPARRREGHSMCDVCWRPALPVADPMAARRPRAWRH